MCTLGATRAARACSAWARPISPPSGVTAALFDMFCGLNGRTLSPRLVKARARPATSSDLPTSEPVPCSISARVIAALSCYCEERVSATRQSRGQVHQARDCFAALAMTARSKLDALLRLDPGAERMLDQGHLGDEVGSLDQLGRRIAPGHNDMQVARLRFQHRDHLLDRQVPV